MAIAFTPDGLKNATKDFKGVIVIAQYKQNPKFQGSQLEIEIQTEEYDKNQHEWYSPSDKKNTKWAHLIEALHKCGALKDISFEGQTVEEKMANFAKSLVGMQCRFVEFTDLPSIAKSRETNKYEIRAIVPTEYFGKVDVGEVRTEVVSEIDIVTKESRDFLIKS